MAKQISAVTKGKTFKYSVQVTLTADMEKVRKELAAELFQFAEDVMKISKDERVPVRTGNLMNSGHVELPVHLQNQITVTMGYGGAAASYALPVHEMMDRKYRRPGSGPKYLENPLKENQDKLPGRLAEAVKRGMT